jgi:hypothetical protein
VIHQNVTELRRRQFLSRCVSQWILVGHIDEVSVTGRYYVTVTCLKLTFTFVCLALVSQSSGRNSLPSMYHQHLNRHKRRRARASLLGLPRELRDSIYAFTDASRTISPPTQTGPAVVALENLPSSNLLRVSRQINDEYRDHIARFVPRLWAQVESVEIVIKCTSKDVARPLFSSIVLRNNEVQQVREAMWERDASTLYSMSDSKQIHLIGSLSSC